MVAYCEVFKRILERENLSAFLSGKPLNSLAVYKSIGLTNIFVTPYLLSNRSFLTHVAKFGGASEISLKEIQKHIADIF